MKAIAMRIIHGPLRPCSGPRDSEGMGRERFWDMTRKQRVASLSDILRMTQTGNAEQDRQFAKGWFAEHQRLSDAAAVES